MTKLERLETLLARQQAEMGWNDAGIYDRDWKKAIAVTKHQIRNLKLAASDRRMAAKLYGETK